MNLRLSVAALLILFLPGFSHGQYPLRVMTFNIRYANPDDGSYSWEKRREMVYGVITGNHPAVIGFQEVLKRQLDDLHRNLPAYAWFGAGRDDGKESGEYAVIFYDSTRLQKLGGSNFWLSETPDTPGSKSWGAGCNRIVTWIKVRDRQSGSVLFFFNTHFDNASELAREKSAVLLCERLSSLCGNFPAVVTGDFNDSTGSKTYISLTAGECLVNSRLISTHPPEGPDYSFIGFPFHPEPGIIDFIFLKNRGSIRVTRNKVLDYHAGDKYPSDHMPVLANLEIPINKK